MSAANDDDLMTVEQFRQWFRATHPEQAWTLEAETHPEDHHDPCGCAECISYMK